MAKKTKAEQSREHMREAATALSEMLAYTVSAVRTMQQQCGKRGSEGYESMEALTKNYDVKSMKELTAILKDVVAVEKALTDSDTAQDAAAATGVVFLPFVNEQEGDSV